MGKRGGIGFWRASAIGVGSMVGGGIFAVLGLAVHLAGESTPLAFVVAGALSVTYPSQGPFAGARSA